MIVSSHLTPSPGPNLGERMSKLAAGRFVSPTVALLAAVALLALALLTGLLTTAGQDRAGAVWNKRSDQAGAVWNTTTRAGAVWNRIGGAQNGAVWN